MGTDNKGVEHELSSVAEQLVAKFSGRVPVTTVIRILSDCAKERDGHDFTRIEAAARARLEAELDRSVDQP